MIVWIPIAVNERPLLRGKIVIPEYSAAVIGSSVVLRVYGGGLTGLSYALTTVPFPTPEAAAEWIEANKFDMAYSAKLGVADDAAPGSTRSQCEPKSRSKAQPMWTILDSSGNSTYLPGIPARTAPHARTKSSVTR
jgi:hypothetical protein